MGANAAASEPVFAPLENICGTRTPGGDAYKFLEFLGLLVGGGPFVTG